MISVSRTLLFCLATTTLASAETPKSTKLTPQRLADLTTDAGVPKYTTCQVSIDGISPLRVTHTPEGLPIVQPAKKPEPASLRFKVDGQPAVMEFIREFRFPIAFDSAKPAPKDSAAPIVPTTPTAFDSVNTGWTIKLTAQQQGKLLAITGVADCVEAEMVPAGYGAAAAPIHAEDGKLISPNKITTPKFQTTTSRFFLFAVPGESCEVTLFRGNKAEKHRVTVTAE